MKSVYVEMISFKRQNVASAQRPTKMKRSRWSRLKIFARETTFHGFKDLYRSERGLARVLCWTAVLLCTTMCAYQLYKSVLNYVSHPISVSISHLKQDYQPPSVKLLLQKFSWINLSIAADMGFSDDSLIYMQSLLCPHIKWNKDLTAFMDAKAEFYRIVSDGKYEKVSSLFRELAYQWPLGLSEPYLYAVPVKGAMPKFKFDHDQAIYELVPLFNESDDAKNIGYNRPFHSFIFDHKLYRDETLRQVNHYNMNMGWLDEEVDVLFQTGSTPPLMPVRPNHNYAVVYDIQLHKLMNTECQTSNDGDLLYNVIECSHSCVKLREPSDCGEGCHVHSSMVDFAGPICSHGVQLPNGTQIGYQNRSKCSNLNSSIDELECQRRCLPSCNNWIVQVTVSEFRKPSIHNRSSEAVHQSQLTMLYPQSSSVLVFEEFNGWTWDAFVGNAGGLLGLWLGGSMMSFFQLIYILTGNADGSQDDEEKRINSSKVSQCSAVDLSASLKPP